MSGMSHRFLSINQYSVELIHISYSGTKRCRQWGSNQGPIDWTICHYTPPPQSRSDRPKHVRQLSSVDVQAAQVARFRLETAGTRLTTKPYEFANGKPQSRPRVPMFQYGMFTKWNFHPSTKEKLVIEEACDSQVQGTFLPSMLKSCCVPKLIEVFPL